jgi:hypothetical protein
MPGTALPSLERQAAALCRLWRGRRHEARAALPRLAAARWGVRSGLSQCTRLGTRRGTRTTCGEARARCAACPRATPPSSSASAGSAAAARWPASAAAESALRDAMRAAVPRKIKQRASKAKRSVATVSRLRHPGIVPVECAFLDEDVVVGQLPRCTSASAAVRAAAMIGGGGTSCALSIVW